MCHTNMWWFTVDRITNQRKNVNWKSFPIMLAITANDRIGGEISNRKVTDTKPVSLSHMSNTGNAETFSCLS